jgi:hypothetical protein
MAETYVLAANKLAGMSETAFLANHGQTFRVLRHLQGSPDENARRIYDLHRRHGQSICDIVDKAIRAHASDLRSQALPDTCLLSLVVTRLANHQGYRDPVELEAKPAEQAAADDSQYLKRPIVFAVDEERHSIRFFGGVSISGANYFLIKALADQFESDLAKRLDKQNYEHVKKERLMKTLGIAEHTLRQRVLRCRKALVTGFREVVGCKLDDDDVIQNREWRGYRLNPSLFMVTPAQLAPETAPARPVTVPPVNVTTLPAE